MTVEAEPPTALNAGRKQSIRERFRDRLLKKPDRSEGVKDNHVERDEGLDDFLKSPSDGDVLPSFPSPYRNPVPRIHISSSTRWPDPQEFLHQVKIGEYGEDDSENPSDLSMRRPKKNKGLVVRFADAAPQIIGEGGEEADAPTRTIAQNKHLAPTDQGSRQNKLDSEEQQFRPRPLVRIPTGIQDLAALKEEAESELNREDATAVQSGVRPASSSLDPSSAGSRRRMREEEGRAFTTGLRDPSPEPPHPKGPTGHKRASETSPSVSVADHGEHQPSPSVSSDCLLISSPPTSRPSTASRDGDSIPSNSEQPRRLEHSPHRAVSSIATSPQRKPLIQRPAPTTEPKEDSLGELRLRARRYYSIFALAAEKMHHLPDVDLSGWIRDATWWFLTAETSFKLLRRDLQGGVDVSKITSSRRLAQAMVDLAKTMWIVEDMVRDWSERENLDLSSPSSVEVLIQASPSSRRAHTLRYWQELCKRLGSLAGAVRRSGFMSPTSEEMPLSTGIDSTIWISYPAIDARISEWLRAASPPWVEMDESVVPKEPSDLATVVPLKSTSKIFRIRSVMCHVSGNFRSESSSPSVPCILTIGRRSGSYALVLFVASQDHSVNLVVETDPIHGDGMEWQHTTFGVIFNFADGFQFLIRLQQADYSQFRDTYDLALKALKAAGNLASRAFDPSERLIFRATCRTFERKSSQRINTFAFEGDQRDCDILLFERYQTSERTPSPQGAPRRLGLKVLLSASNPHLGILDVGVGGEKPLLVHPSGDQNPPRIEMIDIHQASLNIQFSRSQDLNRFYELLTSPDATRREDFPQPMSLHSFFVEPSSAQTQALLSGVRWQHVQVWTGESRSHAQSHRNESLTPLPINIRVLSKEMVIADRLSSGSSQIRFGLSVSNPTSLSIWHVPHPNTSLTLQHRSAPTDAPVMADHLLANLNQNPTTHTYTFNSQSDLHTFQKQLTDSQVLFDAVASSFIVTWGTGLRTKKEDLGSARLQLVHSEKSQFWRILAFFETGQTTSFPIDATDTFEKSHGSSSSSSSSRGKNTVIRLVEARINPPSAEIARSLLSFPTDGDLLHGMVSGDEVVERHDVSIAFEAEETLDLLAQVLPMPMVAKKAGSVIRGALHFR